MPEGEVFTPIACTTMSQAIASTSFLSVLGLDCCDRVEDNWEESSSGDQEIEKDPRKIARKYQLELCKKALEENVIVYLETGSGKTHISILLIYELRHLIRKPNKDVCVFLAPTVALVYQQARVIEDSIGFKVGIYSGSSKRLKSPEDWAKEVEKYEVLVMTPQTLFRNLSHCFMKMESIALLIFDECHHAQVKSNHPYAEIMRVFYKSNATKLPRIFGMTASPVVGKGASSRGNLSKSINSLEKLLKAKVYSVEDKKGLESFVSTPVVRVYYYGPVIYGENSPYMAYSSKLEEMKLKCISALKKKTNDIQSLRNTKKILSRMHNNLIICLENLGLRGALQASRLLSSGDHYELNELMGMEENQSDDSTYDSYLAQAAEMFSSDCTRDGAASDLSSIEILKEPYFSKKLIRLIGVLSSFRAQSNMKCIVFVNRIITARSLSFILQNLKFVASWRSAFLVGVNSGLKSMSRKTMNIILDKFRSGELNLLIATKVGEEGLDIQTCCLVIRFDLPETVASFIQSRGRARMPQSEYAFLVDSGNQRELDLIENFKHDESRMNMEIASRTSSETFIGPEERVYEVDSSGASISSAYSVALLHEYCSKLAHDEHFDPKPKFFYLDDEGGTVCHIIFPSNAPIHLIASAPQLSAEAAKKDACLNAVEELHKIGALNSYLLPRQDEYFKEPGLDPSDSDSSEDDGSRAELHEMLVPSAIKGSWNNVEDPVHLSSYYIEFSPDPADRIYRPFGLFVKMPLPVEAEKMELDLHLARGRSVKTKLVPSGVTGFDKDEIMLAENFQEMFLKVMLDRMEFISGFVPLGKIDTCESNASTFYLLLPVGFQAYDNTMSVDWETIRKCLSSPVFGGPSDGLVKKFFPSDVHLKLADSCRSIHEIKNSLVYAPFRKSFFIITNVNHGRNRCSSYEDSGNLSFAEKIEKSDIQLKYPEQPLLRAKPLFNLHNLLYNRKQNDSGPQQLDEYLTDLPPELCELKIIGFSKDIGSSISLLPSIMHRLENLLVAIELKNVMSVSFPEGSEITTQRVLEALTTEKCQERFSLERLEVLGDAFLKFSVGRHLFLLHGNLDEGELTRRRSNLVSNFNLFKLATRRNLQVYIRDQPFEPSQFFALGRSCPIICNTETKDTIHSRAFDNKDEQSGVKQVKCSRAHHWLRKKTIADAVEALIGAFIVDSGFKAASSFLRWLGIKVDFEISQVTDVCVASTKYVPLAAGRDISSLENSLGYQFLHQGLLLEALLHPSYNNGGGGCFQRLEFLGDAVLDYLMTSYLYSAYPNLKPGHLTDLRSASVNNIFFANVAVDHSVHKFLIYDSSSLSEAIENYVDFIKMPKAEKDLGDGPKCPKVLGDLFESCMGAILLDTGFNLNFMWKKMLSFLEPAMNFSNLQLNPIRELQELSQSYSWDLIFSTSKKGPFFTVEAKVNGIDGCTLASATNFSKRDATNIASQKLCNKLKAQGFMPKFKTLEEILKSTSKLEAKLIGYNETPIDVVVHDVIKFENLNVQGTCHSKFEPKVCCISESDEGCLPSIKPTTGQIPFASEAARMHSGQINENCSSDTDMPLIGRSCIQQTARSCLREVCTAYCWKSPIFECCSEEGPSHLKSYIFKVIVEIDEDPVLILECFSATRSSKKIAAEHASEGALWYLKNKGYLHNSD